MFIDSLHKNYTKSVLCKNKPIFKRIFLFIELYAIEQVRWYYKLVIYIVKSYSIKNFFCVNFSFIETIKIFQFVGSICPIFWSNTPEIFIILLFYNIQYIALKIYFKIFYKCILI